MIANMQKDEITSIFVQAAEIVESLPEILKPKAFELAVAKLSNNLTLDDQQEIQSYTSKPQLSNIFFEKLSLFSNIPTISIETIYKINKENVLEIINLNIDGTIPEKQRNIVLLFLLANIIGFEKKWISTLEVVVHLKKFGINDSNVPRNLKKERGILQSGTKHGKEYTLSPTGLIKAKELLKKLIVV
jgi:hypothetical protein